MNGRNNWKLTVATLEDSQGIQKVFDDGSFTGGISVKFSRAPDPYKSFQNDGDDVILPIAKDIKTDEILGVGGCVIRSEYVNGIIKNTGYLTGMKIMQSHQRRLNCMKEAYQLIGNQASKYNPLYYTTILKSNELAIRLLEKRRKGMPTYNYLGEYTVFCLGTGRRKSRRVNSRVYNGDFQLCHGHTEKLATFYKEHLPKYNLAPASELLYGIDNNDFFYLQSPSGEILAACAIWNQQSYKQYIISGYGGIYKALSHLPTKSFGYPTLPKSGKSANYASIAALIVAEENPAIAHLFIKLILQQAKHYDFVMLGLFENHPLMNVAQKFKHIKYQSRLYSVDFAENVGSAKSADLQNELDKRPIMLEVGLL